MRIEYQGHVQAKTYYTHVGYISAALAESAAAPPNSVPPMLMGAGTLLLVLGLVVAGRAKRYGRWLAGACIAAALASFGFAVWNAIATPSLSPSFYVTLYRLERLCAETEAWTAAHRRPFTEAEWRAAHRGVEARDGWGRRFTYGTFPLKDRSVENLFFDDPPGSYEAAKELGYVIISDGATDKPHSMRSVCSWYLGDDGLFGTVDDASILKYVFRRISPNRYAHARAPRTGGIADAH